MSAEQLTVTDTVAAEPERVFAVLADPRTHAEVDGTGRVREPLDPEPLRELGQLYRMNMYHPKHPDGEYVTVNRIHVIDPPRTIGWRTGYEPEPGRLVFGGWFWRYDLAARDGGTAVTLTYDWSEVPASVREYLEFPLLSLDHLGRSLRHLAERVAAS